MKAATIEINLDKKCSDCGKGGACQNGLCLECVSKKLKEKYAMKIGLKTITTINDSMAYLVSEYQKEINEAWQKCGEEPLSLSIGVKLEVGDGGNTEVTTKFSFVKEKVKDQIAKSVNEDQQELFS